MPTLLIRSPLSPRWTMAVTAILLGATAVLTVVDLTSVATLNLSVLYLLPPLVGAIVLGAGPAVFLAGCAAVGWAVGEPPVPSPPSPVLHDVDAAIRFVAGTLFVVLVDALRRAMRNATDSDRRGRAFLELAAHQMRTPVAVMRASAETLVSMGATEEQEPFLQDLAVESGRIGRMLNNLLWVARLDGGAAYQVRACSPTVACRTELERVERRRPDLRVELAAGRVEWVLLAEDVLRETVANLLDNATRHARSRIDVIVEPTPGAVRVTVRDDGPGLAPGTEEEAFHRFVSFDGGVGLGLSLCRDAARRMGGDLIYRAGAFELRLPAWPAGDADFSVLQPPDTEAEAPSGKEPPRRPHPAGAP